MFPAVFLIFCLAAFPVQLLLCFRARKLLIKAIPLVFLLVIILSCLCMAYRPGWIFSGEDGRLAAFIAAYIGFFVLLADGAAWMIWGIVKFVQKRGK